MNPKTYLLDDDRGVSPVIGVILMVAITVILAAVIATFVMNMGPNEETVPTASWDDSVDEDVHNITISHEGGGAVLVDTLSVRVTGNESSETFDDVASGATVNASEDMTAGDEIVINFDGSGSDVIDAKDTVGGGSGGVIQGAEEVQLIWNAENSDQSEILFTWEP